LRAALTVCVVLAAVALTACGGTATRSDPPLLVPWTGVGDIRLGEAIRQVGVEYGRAGPSGYPLHGGLVQVYDNASGGRVNQINFSTRYYRTKSGFGVGSTLPRAWRGDFIWNPILKQSPCRCWVKVGSGRRSLPMRAAKPDVPFVVIYVRHDRVVFIAISSKYFLD
jgi:hypothetical protein